MRRKLGYTVTLLEKPKKRTNDMIRYRIRRTEKKNKNEIRVEALRFGLFWVTVWRMSHTPEDRDYAQLCAVEVKLELTEER